VTWTGCEKPPATLVREICGNAEVEEEATVRVTGMLFAEPEAPVEAIVTVPLYVPPTKPERSTLTDTVNGAMPTAGVTESQVASLDAAQRGDTPPGFVTDIDWEGGFAPPAWPVNERLPVVTDNVDAVPEADEEVPWHPAAARKERRRAIAAPRIRRFRRTAL